MIEVNSNQEELLQHHDPEFFIEKLSGLEKRIQSLLNQLKNTLTYIAPSDFYDRFDEAQHVEQIDQQWVQNFKDIVAWKIEGRVNVPLMRLAEDLRRQFGGQIIFWLGVVCDLAQNEKYDDNLRIWQVIDAYKSELHLPIGEYQKNRKFRRLAKNDIAVTKKLISIINELKTAKQTKGDFKRSFQDLLPKIQQAYRSYESSNKKMVEFLKSEDQKNKNLEFFESGNPIYAGKRSSEFEVSNSKSRKIFKEQNIYKQKMITDFSVQMGDDKNRQLLKKIVGKDQRQLDQDKVNQLENFFFNISNGVSSSSIQNLRNQFIQSKSKLLSKTQTLYTNFLSQLTIIEYYDFPIFPEICPFKQFSNPFEESEAINYDCTEYQLYEEFEAEGVELDETDSEENSDDDSLDEMEKRDFFIEDNDGYQMDDEDRFVKTVAFRMGKEFGGNQWVFNYKEQQPFWINQRHQKSEKKKTNEDSSESESQAPYTFLTEDMKHDMIQSFYLETIVFIPNKIPMFIDEEDKKPKKQIELTQQQTEKLKQIFIGKTHHQAMDIIYANQFLAEQFYKAKIKTFTSKLSKKWIKNDDGKKIFVYFVNENKENQLGVQNFSKENQADCGDQDSEENFDELETSPNDPEYMPSRRSKLSVDQKSRSSSQRISNQKSFSIRVQEQPQSQSSSFANDSGNVTNLNRSSQNNKSSASNHSKSSHLSSLASSNISRLRPRNSRPNYNLSQILGTSRVNKKEEKDIEI